MKTSKGYRQNRQRGLKKGFLKTARKAFIWTILIIICLALSSCSTSVEIANPITPPKIPQEEINKQLDLLIMNPETEYDLMHNAYVYEGLILTYADFVDEMQSYLDKVALTNID